MSNHNVADGTGVRVMREKCSTCIFRPGNLMELRPGRVKQMVADCLRNDGVIPCHQTLDKPKQAICHGFYEAHGDKVWPVRLAKAVNAIRWHNVRKESP